MSQREQLPPPPWPSDWPADWTLELEAPPNQKWVRWAYLNGAQIGVMWPTKIYPLRRTQPRGRQQATAYAWILFGGFNEIPHLATGTGTDRKMAAYQMGFEVKRRMGF